MRDSGYFNLTIVNNVVSDECVIRFRGQQNYFFNIKNVTVLHEGEFYDIGGYRSKYNEYKTNPVKFDRYLPRTFRFYIDLFDDVAGKYNITLIDSKGNEIITLDPWYDSRWNYAMRITFDNSDSSENLVNFPVYVNLTRADAESKFNFSTARANGFDLRFVEPDNITDCDYEREYYNQGTETGDLWVEVPQIDAGSTTDYITLYWGYALAPDGEDITGTWNSNYEAVWHLYDNPDVSTVQDSTINNNDGVKKGANEPLEANGQIYMGQDLDGGDDRIVVSDDDSLTTMTGLTLEGLIYLHTAKDDRNGIINKYDASGSDRSYSMDIGKNNDDTDNTTLSITVSQTTNPFNGKQTFGTTKLSTGQWYYAVTTWEADHQEVYLDGIEETDDIDVAIADSIPNNVIDLYLGYMDDENSYIDSIFDEPRISRVRRSGEWIEATNFTLFDNYITFGSLEEYSITLQIYVIDSDGEGLETALVSVVDLFDELTNGTGYTSEYNPDVDNYTITVTLNGYNTFTGTFEFTDNLIYTVTLSTFWESLNLELLVSFLVWICVSALGFFRKERWILGIGAIIGVLFGLFFMNDPVIYMFGILGVNFYILYLAVFSDNLK